MTLNSKTHSKSSVASQPESSVYLQTTVIVEAEYITIYTVN